MSLRTNFHNHREKCNRMLGIESRNINCIFGGFGCVSPIGRAAYGTPWLHSREGSGFLHAQNRKAPPQPCPCPANKPRWPLCISPGIFMTKHSWTEFHHLSFSPTSACSDPGLTCVWIFLQCSPVSFPEGFSPVQSSHRYYMIYPPHCIFSFEIIIYSLISGRTATQC